MAFSDKTEKQYRSTVIDSERTDWPHISVIIPIRNEERFIARTLQYVLGQDYPADRLEVLVVDGESTDQTRRIVEQIAATDGRVRLLTNPKRLSSAARAIGVREATGDLVTFVDGHVYVDNLHLLRNTAVLLRQREVSVLSRPQFLETPDNSPFQQAVAVARRSMLGHGRDSTIFMTQDRYVNPTSSGATYCREVFDRVGNFDERFDACEDVEFNYRVAKAGFSSFTSMQLAVYYYPRETLGLLFGQMKRYGIGRFRLARRHPGTLSISTLIPFGFVIGLPLSFLAGLLWRPFLALAGVTAGLYLLITLGTSVYLAARHGWRHLFVLPQIFWTIHVGLGWGFAVELWRTLAGESVRFR